MKAPSPPRRSLRKSGLTLFPLQLLHLDGSGKERIHNRGSGGIRDLVDLLNVAPVIIFASASSRLGQPGSGRDTGSDLIS